MTNKKGKKDGTQVQLQDLEFEARFQKLRNWNRARIRKIKNAKDPLTEILKDRAFILKKDRNGDCLEEIS